jgi:hypothetical protein
MADERKEPFVPMVNEQGRVTGIMDRTTADYLASTDPNPTQVALDAVFARVTRARLVGYRIENRVFQFDVVRLDISDPAQLAELRECLRIVENPDSFGHMMSIEDHRLELWAGEQQRASLALLSWIAVRWPSVWKHDAWLADPRRFEGWLLQHGIPDAQQRREADERREVERLQCIERWERAMPPCLRPLWPKGFGEYGDAIDAARAALESTVPDPVERVRALYEWFGSGAGQWSGFPSYESAAEKLLMEYPIETLLAAIDTNAATAQVLGAARLFGGWDFGQKRKGDRAHCHESLRQRMRHEVERQGIADNLARFRGAFGLPK